MQRWLTPRTRVAIAASVLFAEQPLLGLTAFLSLSVALGDALSLGARVCPSIWVFSRLDHAHALSWTLVRHLSSNGTSTVMISRAHSPSALPSLSAPGLDYAADGPNVAGRSGMSREKVLGVVLLGFARTKRWAAQASVVSVRSGSGRAVI